MSGSSHTAPSAARIKCLSIAEVCSPDGPFRRCYFHGILSERGCYLFYHHSVVWSLTLHSNSREEKIKGERKVMVGGGGGGGGG
jgi:hypothetical protein